MTKVRNGKQSQELDEKDLFPYLSNFQNYWIIAGGNIQDSSVPSLASGVLLQENDSQIKSAGILVKSSTVVYCIMFSISDLKLTYLLISYKV